MEQETHQVVNIITQFAKGFKAHEMSGNFPYNRPMMSSILTHP